MAGWRELSIWWREQEPLEGAWISEGKSSALYWRRREVGTALRVVVGPWKLGLIGTQILNLLFMYFIHRKFSLRTLQCLFIYLYLYFSIYIYQSFYFSAYQSAHMSFYLFICLFTKINLCMGLSSPGLMVIFSTAISTRLHTHPHAQTQADTHPRCLPIPIVLLAHPPPPAQNAKRPN